MISTKDVQTTAGSKILKGYISPFDATVVARLKEAGMVNLGELNLDEFAMPMGRPYDTPNSNFRPAPLAI